MNTTFLDLDIRVEIYPEDLSIVATKDSEYHFFRFRHKSRNIPRVEIHPEDVSIVATKDSEYHFFRFRNIPRGSKYCSN